MGWPRPSLPLSVRVVGPGVLTSAEESYRNWEEGCVASIGWIESNFQTQAVRVAEV